MTRLARFFAKPVAQGHEAGTRASRPWLRGFKALMLAGLVSLTLAAPAQAFTSNPLDFGNPMNYVNPISPWCMICDDAETMTWEDYRRVDAIKIQAAEQGIADPKDKRLVIDEARVDAYVADRVEERNARNAARGDESFRIQALERQAAEQGLPGWADDRFHENRGKTRQYIQQAREKQQKAKEGMMWLLGGVGGLAAAGYGVSAMANRRREQEWQREQERLRKLREDRQRNRDGGDHSPLI